MAYRSAPVQGLPGDVSAFPAWSPDLGSVWFRVHRDHGGTGRGCWYFASAPLDPEEGGRFDLPQPVGTCYFAETPEAAAREAIATTGDQVDEARVDGRHVSIVGLPVIRLADLLDARAANHGVTGELSASCPYKTTQAWALAFHSVGLEGVRYQPRFSTARVDAIALFGNAGPHDMGPTFNVEPLESLLLRMGVRVLPVPRSTAPGVTWTTPPTR